MNTVLIILSHIVYFIQCVYGKAKVKVKFLFIIMSLLLKGPTLISLLPPVLLIYARHQTGRQPVPLFN